MRDNMKGGALTEVTFYILLSLYAPKHGYAVMQFIEEKTGGRLSLGAGTLYGALNSLQEKKCCPFCLPIALHRLRLFDYSYCRSFS